MLQFDIWRTIPISVLQYTASYLVSFLWYSHILMENREFFTIRLYLILQFKMLSTEFLYFHVRKRKNNGGSVIGDI